MSAVRYARQVAYVPQTLEPAKLTVKEMVALGRNPHQDWWQWEGTAHDRQVIELALERTGLSNLADRQLGALSGGERQRTAIATALAQEPQFLLLDEPTAHLDFRFQLEIAQLLQELKEHSLGIAVVLHDLNLIWRLADRVGYVKAEPGEPARVVTETPALALSKETLKQIFEVEVSVVCDQTTGDLIFAPIKQASN